MTALIGLHLKISSSKISGDKITVRKNMVISVSVFAVTVVLMICGILFFPVIKIGKLEISTFWVVTLAGATVMLFAGGADINEVGRALVEDTTVNPLKILVLFISMTILSVFLDELGFFRFLANAALKRARSGQKTLFLYLYITVSVLTVFTSNDVIILSFTPFICYFAKHAKIDPVPYLSAEFVAANTWSMALIIGNPTNIYLATACGLDFAGYLKFSIIPTVFAGVVSFVCLFLLFGKKLSAPLSGDAENVFIEDKFLLWVGIVHLAVCTVLLAISSYIGLQMWIISLCAAASLFIISFITYAVRHKTPVHVLNCLKRAPWQLIPFILSMFVMITVLGQNGAITVLGNFLGTQLDVWKYGAASFFACNIINNIPMSVLFSAVIREAGAGMGAVMATVIGSNLGACFTPLGALAGIMFGSILSHQGIKFGYLRFLKVGIAVALPALAAALGGLCLSIYFI